MAGENVEEFLGKNKRGGGGREVLWAKTRARVEVVQTVREILRQGSFFS
jgi:hypothetical protein